MYECIDVVLSYAKKMFRTLAVELRDAVKEHTILRVRALY
jgi:hypothetical protein